MPFVIVEIGGKLVVQWEEGVPPVPQDEKKHPAIKAAEGAIDHLTEKARKHG